MEALRERIARGDDVDGRDGAGATPLRWACGMGHLECVQALIDANAAVDMVNNNGDTALMRACINGHHECAQALIDAQADLELMNRDGRNALMIACESPPSYYSQSKRQGKIRCALAILAATAPIREPDSRDRAASLKLACDRLQLIEAVLASTHVIEYAPLLTRARDLQTDALGIIVTFAGEMLTIAKLQSLVVDPAGSLPSAQ